MEGAVETVGEEVAEIVVEGAAEIIAEEVSEIVGEGAAEIVVEEVIESKDNIVKGLKVGLLCC